MMKSKKGKLILIPCTIGDTEVNKVLPQENTTYINSCSEFIVENIRSARRFLIKSNINTAIDDLKFHLLNKHTKEYELSAMLKCIEDGKNIGLLSEAGCPGIADPGADIVKLAHFLRYKCCSFSGSIVHFNGTYGVWSQRSKLRF